MYPGVGIGWPKISGIGIGWSQIWGIGIGWHQSSGIGIGWKFGIGKSLLQDDLNAIIQWSRENNLKLHEDKLDLISNRADPKLLMHELPFSMETCTYKLSDSIELFPIDCLKRPWNQAWLVNSCYA